MIRFWVAAGLGLLYIALVPVEPYAFNYLLKAAPMLLLASLALTAKRPLFVAALLASALGDALLAIDRTGLLTAALGAFLVTQLCYLAVFWSARAPTRARLLLATVVALVALAYLAVMVMPELAGPRRYAVPIYGMALAAMAAGAIISRLPRRVAVGAVLFVVADSLIAWNQFVTPFANATIVIVAIYFCAQLLIVHGALLVAVQRRSRP